MNKYLLSAVALFVSPLLLIGCFSVDRRGGVVGFKGREIETGFGKFEVGSLPEGWSKPKNQLKQIVYENDSLESTIVVDALCGPKFVDTSLRRLALDLFDRLEKVKIGKEKEFVLDGRRAHQMAGQGAMDGIPFSMEVVVMKKNYCLYDFVVFSPEKHFLDSKRDFENYVSEFRAR